MYLFAFHFSRSNACTIHKRYERSRSNSAKDVNYDGTLVNKGAARDQITVTFGTGEISGVFMEDDICELHTFTGLWKTTTVSLIIFFIGSVG